MKAAVKFAVLAMVMVLTVSVGTGFSADPAASKNKYPVGTVLGKDGKPVTAQPPAVADLMAPKPPRELAGTGVTPVAEANRIGPTSVTVDPLPCQDFQYSGDVILPAHRGDDYLCPPGYECKGVVGGVQCRWRNLSSMASNSPECRMQSCANALTGEALEHAFGG